MGEGVCDGSRVLKHARREIDRSLEQSRRGVFNRCLKGNELPHVRPSAGGGALLDQILIAARGGATDTEGPALDQWCRFGFAWRGDALLLAMRTGLTEVAYRTDQA